jgi:predicted signal transduction protein with EAL and GGDEF domain
MTAIDNDAGDNGRVDFSTVYISSQKAAFGVRTSSSNPKVAELYTLDILDREQSTYGTFTYNGSVMITVIRCRFCLIQLKHSVYLNTQYTYGCLTSIFQQILLMQKR